MARIEFKGKQFIHSHHHSVPYKELRVAADKSLSDTPSLDDNLIIHGDNLHALKALLPRYAGKIDCIYIDPPYNTGNEGWCYNDNVNSPIIKEWLKKEGNPVDKEDMERHDKWLCMMWPRLQLLRELLSDTGVIFVSIDDNEVHRLRMIMDEVFEADKHIATVVWQKRYSRENREAIGDVHEYVMVYAKNPMHFKSHRNLLPPTEEQLKVYRNPNNDPKGRWRPIPMTAQAGHATKDQFYEITAPAGKVHIPPDGRCWGISKATFETLLADGRIYFGKDNNSQPNIIRYVSEVEGFAPWTWWPSDEAGHTDASKKELYSILGTSVQFDNLKPSKLLKRIFQIATNPNSIILDSFAGSGTTAHAVLDLNKQDGGNRKFILVEMEDYANDITAERVRRVIKGVPTAKDKSLQEGLGGSFTFAELGDPFEIDKILSGESLPSYGALASYVFYTATGQSLPVEVTAPAPDYYIGESNTHEVYLVYKPDLAFLRSNQSALDQDKLNTIIARKSSKPKLVFATAKYMGQSALSDYNISFCQLPYAIHRIVN